MLDLVIPMGSVIASWLLFFLLFVGLGLLALRAVGRRLSSGWLVLDCFWLGWSLTLAFLQLWHFAFPVNDAVLSILAVVAAFMLLRQWPAIQPILGRLRQQRAYILAFALLLLWFANRSLGMPIAYDTGLRDIQAVMWIDSYAIVPGLGNLFSSLAFNHSVYLYDALLDTAIWSGRSYRIATGLLLVVYLAYTTRSAISLWRCRDASGFRWSWVVALLSIPYVLFYTVRYGGIVHFLTDTVVDIIGFLTLIYMLDFLQDWHSKSSADNYQILRLAILISTGLAVKQTYIIYGLATAILALIVWIRRGGFGLGRGNFFRLLLPTILFTCAVVFPWMARGVVTSGYIAYPHIIGRFEFDWTFPRADLEARQRTLARNTRQRGSEPDSVLTAHEWLGPWLRRFVSSAFATLMPSVISVGALFLYAVGLARRRCPDVAHRTIRLAVAPILAMLALWFFSFPEDKYASYLFWSLAAISVLLACFSWHDFPFRPRILSVFILAAICLMYVVFLVIRDETGPLPAGPDDGFYNHWVTIHDQFETDHGLIVNVPVFGFNQCWSAPLPCTPHPKRNLRERVPGELGHGFRLEGTDSTTG